jgi:signal transduction histidine kinase
MLVPPTTGGTPPEAMVLRAIGLGWLAVFLASTVTTEPHPSFHGKGFWVLAAFIVFGLGVVISNPRRPMAESRRIGGLLLVAAGAAVLAGIQPKGLWVATPYFIAVVTAATLPGRKGVWVLGIALTMLAVVAGARGEWDLVLSGILGALPWFLIVRLIRRLRNQNLELEASRAAEAQAAAAAERARVAREMHDVLAHSLSALALQLETTRLFARDRDADPELTRGIDRAHGLAAEGLEEARRAIGALRGDELPGPERLFSLAEAFEEQSGLPVEVEVQGESRALPAEARLTLYRTAQEALTNIRRHATPERVQLQLDYRDGATVLTVADHADGPPPSEAENGGGGYGLTGMRERAELLGGQLVAEPTADGFRVELWLPA